MLLQSSIYCFRSFSCYLKYNQISKKKTNKTLFHWFERYSENKSVFLLLATNYSFIWDFAKYGGAGTKLFKSLVSLNGKWRKSFEIGNNCFKLLAKQALDNLPVTFASKTFKAIKILLVPSSSCRTGRLSRLKLLSFCCPLF